MKKGQISIGIAMIGLAGTIMASVITAWGVSSNRVSKIDKQIGIVEERENNHYLEVKDKLENIDEKLDQIIKNQNGK